MHFNYIPTSPITKFWYELPDGTIGFVFARKEAHARRELAKQLNRKILPKHTKFWKK